MAACPRSGPVEGVWGNREVPQRGPRYTPSRKRAPSRSASREAEGTGPMKPRQPALAARCQSRPGTRPDGCVERAGRRCKCPRKRRLETGFSNGSRAARRSSPTAAWAPSSRPPCRASARPEEANLRAPDAVVSAARQLHQRRRGADRDEHVRREPAQARAPLPRGRASSGSTRPASSSRATRGRSRAATSSSAARSARSASRRPRGCAASSSPSRRQSSTAAASTCS